MNWKEQAATSHYQTAVAIQQALMAKNIVKPALSRKSAD